MENQQTDGVSGVGFGQGVRIAQTASQSLADRLSVGSDGALNVLGNLSDGANGGGALDVLRRANELENRLLEDLEQLGEGGTKSSRETNNNVKCCVDDKPVILRRAAIGLGFLFLVPKILLTRMRSRNQSADN